MARSKPRQLKLSSISEALLDQIRETVYLVDTTGRFLYVNEEACRLLGYKKEELLALTLPDIDTSLVQEGWENYREAVLNRLPVSTQRLYRSRVGSTVHLEVQPSRFEHDGTAYLLLLAEPFSGVPESDGGVDYYLDIFNNSPDGLYLLEVTEDGRFRNLDINPALARSMGMRAADAVGRFIDETVPKETSDAVAAKYRRCIEAGHSIQEIIQLDLPAGSLWYHSTLMPVRDATGRVHRIVGISRDITEQKRIETAQRDSERRYRDVFENSLEGIFLVEVTPEKRFRSIEQNPALEKITGITYEQAVGHTVEETLPEPVASQVNAFYNWVLETGQTQQAVVELELPKVGQRFLNTTVIPVRDAAGRIYRLAGITRDVTETKRMDKALRESEQRLRDIFDNTLDSIYLIEVTEDNRFRALAVNPAFEKATGFTRAMAEGRFMEEIFPKADADVVNSLFARVVASGTIYESETEVNVPNGWRTFFTTFVPARDAAGRIHRLIGITRDVTEKRRIQAALARKEREFHTLVESLPENVVRYDAKGNITYVNPACCESMGLSREAMLTLNINDAPLLPGTERYRDIILRGTATDAPEDIKVVVERPDGERRIHLMRCLTERDEAGAMIGTIAIGRDITESERAAALLHARAEAFRAVVENSPDFIIRYDVDGYRIYINPTAERLFQRPASEIVGTNLRDFSALPSGVVLTDLLQKVVKSGKEARLETPFTASDGARHWGDLRLVPEFGADGKVMSVLAIGRDVTNLKENELQFRSLAENMPDNIIRYNSAGVVTYVNERFAKSMEGFVPPVHVGQCVDDFRFNSHARKEIGDLVRKGTPTSAPVEIKYRFRSADGTEAVHLVRYITERDESGAITGTLTIGRDITEQERAAALLHERAEAFRALVENSPDVIIRYNLQGIRIYANPAAAAFSRKPVEELLGRSPAEWTSLPASVRLPELIAEVAQGLGEREVEASVTRENGYVDWRLVRVVPEFGVDGKVMSVLVVGRDISSLKKSEMEFRSLAENLPDNVIRYDAKGKVVYANPSLLQLFGVPPEAVKDLSVDHLPDTDSGRRQKEIILHGTPTSAPEEVKVELLTLDGEERIHLVRLVTERDEKGNRLGTLAIGRDITELERTAALVHERAETFRALVEHSPDMIARYDREGLRLYANPAMERNLGGATDGPDAWSDVLSATPESEAYRNLIRLVFELGEEFQGEMPVTTSAGEHRWSHLRVVPEFGPEGSVVSVLAVGRDITMLKQTEERLEESRAELRELAARRETAREEERKRLAREMHDELGQLLMALRLEITIAEHQPGSQEPRMREKIGRMMSLVDRTSRVVRELVAALRPAALDMGLVSALEWLASDFKERTSIQVELRVGERDVHLSEERSVTLFRIVQESLTNVARHAHATRVTIALERRGSDFYLEVRDNGCGFDPKITRKNSFGLVGLRERALALSGTAKVDSTPGVGTTISVNVPEEQNIE